MVLAGDEQFRDFQVENFAFGSSQQSDVDVVNPGYRTYYEETYRTTHSKAKAEGMPADAYLSLLWDRMPGSKRREWEKKANRKEEKNRRNKARKAKRKQPQARPSLGPNQQESHPPNQEGKEPAQASQSTLQADVKLGMPNTQDDQWSYTPNPWAPQAEALGMLTGQAAYPPISPLPSNPKPDDPFSIFDDWNPFTAPLHWQALELQDAYQSYPGTSYVLQDFNNPYS